MKYFYYALIGAGILAVLWALGFLGPAAAPLNASGYTYPSSPGA